LLQVFEGKMKDLLDNRLSFAPRLLVQDGAIGSSRATEIRTRFITDSPVTALAARALLHRIPLYSPVVFPRTITVYAATHIYVRLGAAVAQAAAHGPLPHAATSSVPLC